MDKSPQNIQGLIKGRCAKYVKLGDDSIKQRHLDEAYKAYDEVCNKCKRALQKKKLTKKKREALYIQWGTALLRKKEYKEAIKKFKRANELNPMNAETISSWGKTLIEQRKDREAESKIRAAIEIDPKCVTAYRRLSFILIKQGRVAEAIKECNKGIEIGLKDSILYYNLGDCLAEYGDGKQAIEMYKKALQLSPDLGDALINWGCVLEKEGKIDEAIEKCAQAVKVQPGYDIFYEVWERVLIKRGRTLEAILVSCLKRPSNFNRPEDYCKLGEELFIKGSYNKAISLFEEVKKLYPDSPLAYVGLAEVYLYQGRIKESKSAWEMAKSKNPSIKSDLIDFDLDDFGLALKPDQKPKCEQDSSLTSSQSDMFLSFSGDPLINRWRDQDQEKSILEIDVEVEPKDYHGYCRLGSIHLSKGNYEAAKKYFKKAVPLYGYPLKAFNLWAAVEYYQGNYDEAISIYNQAAVIFPSLYKNLYHTCEPVYEIQSKSKEPILKFRKDVLKINQADFLEDLKNFRTYSFGARMHKAYKEAVSRHCQARNLPLNNKLDFLIYVALLWLQKNREKAVLTNKQQTYDPQTQIDCEYECNKNRKEAKYDTYVSLGDTFSLKNNFSDAISNYERAIKLKQDDSQIYWKWGNALAASQRYEEAIKKYEDAEKIAIKESQAHYDISQSQHNDEHYGDAIMNYYEAVNINFGLVETYIDWINALYQQGESSMEVKQKADKLEKALQVLEKKNSFINASVKTVAFKCHKIFQNMNLILDENINCQDLLKFQGKYHELTANAPDDFNYNAKQSLFSPEALREFLEASKSSRFKDIQSMLYFNVSREFSIRRSLKEIPSFDRPDLPHQYADSTSTIPKCLFNASDAKANGEVLKESREQNSNLEKDGINIFQQSPWDISLCQNHDKYYHKDKSVKECSISHQTVTENSQTQENMSCEKLDLLKNEESSQGLEISLPKSELVSQPMEEEPQSIKQKDTSGTKVKSCYNANSTEMNTILKLLFVADPISERIIIHALESTEWLRFLKRKAENK